MWRDLVYLIVAPAYLAVASGVFVGARLVAPLFVSSPIDQTALELIGTGIVLTGCVKLALLLDD